MGFRNTIAVVSSRVDFFRMLKDGGVGGEIGVANGDFSQVMLDKSKPKKIHLIDRWDMPSNDGPGRHKRVVKKFDNNPCVEIHKLQSDEAVKLFPDQYFDWLYIDGAHRYPNVLSDLQLYHSKVKDDGFVFCHDFNSLAECLPTDSLGVMCAIIESIQDGLYEMIAMSEEVTLDPEDAGITWEGIPSIALKKSLTNCQSPV